MVRKHPRRNRISPACSRGTQRSAAGCKISLYENRKSCICYAVPPPHEGRFAIVTDVGSWMRWTLWRRARSFVRTNGAEADGKGVWSWPPDAEAKSCGDEPRGD